MKNNWLIFLFCEHLQNLFAQQSMDTPKFFPATQTAVETTEPGDKPHTLEQYSYDHFRYVLILVLVLLGTFWFCYKLRVFFFWNFIIKKDF